MYNVKAWEDLAETECQKHLLVQVVRVTASAEDEEDHITCGYLNPLLNWYFTMDWNLHDGRKIGPIHFIPVIRILHLERDDVCAPYGIRKEYQDDEDTYDEEADEA